MEEWGVKTDKEKVDCILEQERDTYSHYQRLFRWDHVIIARVDIFGDALSLEIEPIKEWISSNEEYVLEK
jgi:hypothetical protein